MVEINGQNSNATVPIQKSIGAKVPIELEANNPSSDSAVLQNPLTEELNPEITNIHEQEIHEAPTKASSTKLENLSSIQEFFKNGPEWFQYFRNYFVMGLNSIGIALNSTSVIATNSNIMPKPVAEYLDKAAEWYSRYVVPLGFAWNGVESLVGKRPLESIARFAPAIGFLALPFYNFNLVTGLSSGITYLLGKVVERNGNKQPGVGSAMENTKGILKHTVDVFKELFDSKSKESTMDKISILGMMIGSTGGLFMAPNQRDSFTARIFGTLRNIGGLVGDYELVFNNDQTWRGKHKRAVGLTCSLASILNMIARFVDPKLGRTLNHLSIAADDFGLTYWAQMSKKDNDEASGKKPKVDVDIVADVITDKLNRLSQPVKETNATKEHNYSQAA
jgi:hypothetical protein